MQVNFLKIEFVWSTQKPIFNQFFSVFWEHNSKLKVYIVLKRVQQSVYEWKPGLEKNVQTFINTYRKVIIVYLTPFDRGCIYSHLIYPIYILNNSRFLTWLRRSFLSSNFIGFNLNGFSINTSAYDNVKCIVFGVGGRLVIRDGNNHNCATDEIIRQYVRLCVCVIV